MRLGSVEVSGIDNTSSNSYSKPWVKRWEEIVSQEAGKCVEVNCKRAADRGGHVWKTSDRSKRHCYIIPICRHHNLKQYDRGGNPGNFLTKPDTYGVKMSSHEAYA